MGFVPIQLRDYVRLFLKSNRGETAEAVTARLRSAIEAHKAGERCDCGEPIWVIGSAEAGHACFTCITGEADPSEDYEIAEACDKHSVRSRGGRRKGGPSPDEYGQQPVSMPRSAARPAAAPSQSPPPASSDDPAFNPGITDDDVPF
jgi:hypothetical protein